MAVLGVFVLRKRRIDIPFKMPLFPIPAILFLGLTGWSMYFIFVDRPEQSLWGLLSLVAGLIVYGLNHLIQKGKGSPIVD
jgi:APA family basic amino acid/polyamine antiporter